MRNLPKKEKFAGKVMHGAILTGFFIELCRRAAAGKKI